MDLCSQSSIIIVVSGLRSSLETHGGNKYTRSVAAADSSEFVRELYNGRKIKDNIATVRKPRNRINARKVLDSAPYIMYRFAEGGEDSGLLRRVIGHGKRSS